MEWRKPSRPNNRQSKTGQNFFLMFITFYLYLCTKQYREIRMNGKKIVSGTDLIQYLAQRST